MLPNDSPSFIINNVKGIQLSKKRLKIQYFKKKIGSTGALFLKENSLNSKVEQKWKEYFKGHVFFSHEKSNSCGVLDAYFEKELFTVKKQEPDKEGHILILDVSINYSEYIVINLYGNEAEKEQINVLSNMFVLLEKFEINYGGKKHVIMAGDFSLFLDSKLNAQGGNLS